MEARLHSKRHIRLMIIIMYVCSGRPASGKGKAGNGRSEMGDGDQRSLRARRDDGEMTPDG